MKRLFTLLGISSISTIFWFCGGYFLSLLFKWSINIALVLATLAFIFSFVFLSLLGNDTTEGYR